jgi:hypothetical protein
MDRRALQRMTTMTTNYQNGNKGSSLPGLTDVTIAIGFEAHGELETSLTTAMLCQSFTCFLFAFLFSLLLRRL